MRTRLCFEIPLTKLGRSPSPEKQVRIGLTTEAREGPKTQDKAERLMVATGHVFEDVMADCHPLGIAGQVAGKSSNAQWASEQFWRKYGVDLNGAAPAASSFLSAVRTYSGILAGANDGPRHGDVRIGEPRPPILRLSSHLRLGHHTVHPASHRNGKLHVVVIEFQMD